MKLAKFDLDALEALIRDHPDPRTLIDDGFLREVKVVCHPDRYPGDRATQQRADGLRRRVEQLAQEAATPAIVLRSPQREYTLVQRVAVGDVADIHMGVAAGISYIVKVSRIPRGHKLMEAEEDALATILAAKSGYDARFPTLLESFPIRDQLAKRANVFRRQEGYHTLEAIHDRVPAIGPRHLAWMYNRTLETLAVAHRCGLVHGAVCPSHLLIDPEHHRVQLIGWGQSVKAGSRLAQGSSRYLSYYPEEARDKKPVSGTLDIYMAAKTLIYAAGGDPASGLMPPPVPREFNTFLRSCLLERPAMRPDDAFRLLDEFSEVLRRLYGPPKFCTFEW